MIERLIGGLLLSSFVLAQTPDLAAVALMDLEGRQVTAASHLTGGVRVLTYTGVGCPISNKLAPRLEGLSRRYADRGVRFVGVNANPQDSRAKIATEAAELGITFPILRDFRQELTRALGARTTTEVFLFDATGVLRYRGALDDQYGLGTAKPAPSRTYLSDAIDAVLEGRGPVESETEAPGCLLTLLDPEDLPEAITWSSHVAAIVHANCTVCHREGQVGPFPLVTYEQARGWAKMIGAVVEEGRMPPWNAAPQFDGVFSNERRLSPDDEARLLKWVEDGMPRGIPADEPPAPTFGGGWRIGEPDEVFSMDTQVRRGPLPEEGYAVPREGVVAYKYFSAQTSFEEDRWVQAIEVRPGAPDVVHHVLILVDDRDASRAERARQLDFRSYFAVAVPGETPSVYPADSGKRLPAGARLVFQVHYTPNGKERFDRSSVAVRFCKTPPANEVITRALFNQHLKIPPGAAHHEVRAKKRIWRDTAVVGFFPHMHTRGKDFSFVLHPKEGEPEVLCAGRFDFNWQESYLLARQRVLPKGAHLEVIGHYDNSAANLNNPDPTATVRWGDQTWEEMFIGYYDTVQPVQ